MESNAGNWDNGDIIAVAMEDAASPLCSRSRQHLRSSIHTPPVEFHETHRSLRRSDKSWILQADMLKEGSLPSQLRLQERLRPGCLRHSLSASDVRRPQDPATCHCQPQAATNAVVQKTSPTDLDVTRLENLSTCGCHTSAATNSILQELRAFQEEVRSEFRAQEERIVRMESYLGAGSALQTIDDAVKKQLERHLSIFMNGFLALSADVQQVLEAYRAPQIVMPTIQEDVKHELLASVSEACESDELAVRAVGTIPTLTEQLRERICRSNVADAVEAAAVPPEQCESRFSPARTFPIRAAGFVQALKEQPSMAATSSNPCFSPCGANDMRSRLEELDKFQQALIVGSSSFSAANTVMPIAKSQQTGQKQREEATR